MEELNLGIIGLGRGFMLTLPALVAQPMVRMRAAFDLRTEALAAFTTQFGGRTHGSVASILADPLVEAVYIATPHELHAEQAIAALRAGKHVLVEKPMATSLSDCAAMASAAAQAGRVLMVGPSHGFDEPVLRTAALVASGQFGRVRMVTAFNFTDFIFRPRRAEELDDSKGGGVVYSQAAHQIDVVRRIIGKPVLSVRAVAANWDASRPSNGAYTALMTFAGGAAATLTYSGYAHYDSDELLGWVSELGANKNPLDYGAARRALAGLSPVDETSAKLQRTFGAPGSTLVNAAPHHEHFGFVLVSCEQADLKIMPHGIEVYADQARDLITIAPPKVARAAVINEFIGAIALGKHPVQDAVWGLETMACCVALHESSRRSLEINIETLMNPPNGA